MARYRKQVIGHVGPRHLGFRNLRPFGSGGEQTVERMFPESWRWPSVHRYHTQSLSSQITLLLDTVQSFVGHIDKKNAPVVYNALVDTFKKSQVYCPVDPEHKSGTSITLRQSGRLTVRDAGRGNTVVEISYGRLGNPYYAVFVHEILTYEHAPPTRAKFLESAIKEDMQLIENKLADGMKTLMGA